MTFLVAIQDVAGPGSFPDFGHTRAIAAGIRLRTLILRCHASLRVEVDPYPCNLE